MRKNIKQKYFTIGQVSERIGICYDRIWYACAMKRVNPLKIDRTYLFTEKNIEQVKHWFTLGGTPC